MGACTSKKNYDEPTINNKIEIPDIHQNSITPDSINESLVNENLRPEKIIIKDFTIDDIINAYFSELKSKDIIIFDIIPCEIIKVCVLYYGEHYTKSIYFKTPGVKWNTTQIARFDMNSAEITWFKATTGQNFASVEALCYIPDAIPDQQLDAVLCMSDSCIPILMLINSENGDSEAYNADIFTLSRIKAVTDKFLYCGRGQIFCVEKGRLHRMVLSTKINEILNNDMFVIWDKNAFWEPSDEVVMFYLKNRQQIFAMNEMLSSEEYRICGVFDMKNRLWSKIDLPFELERPIFRLRVGCRLCYDGENMVYYVSRSGDVYGYNLNKEEWLAWTDQKYWSSMKSFTVWIEASDKQYIYFMGTTYSGKIQLNYFDVETAKWKRRNGYNVLTEKLGERALVLD